LTPAIPASVAVRYFPRTAGRDGRRAEDARAFNLAVEGLSTETSCGLIPRLSLSRPSILDTDAFGPRTGMMITAPPAAEVGRVSSREEACVTTGVCGAANSEGF